MLIEIVKVVVVGTTSHHHHHHQQCCDCDVTRQTARTGLTGLDWTIYIEFRLADTPVYSEDSLEANVVMFRLVRRPDSGGKVK